MLSFFKKSNSPFRYEHPIPYGERTESRDNITISNLEHVCPSCDDHATMHVY
jgi:hypothetical protein